VMPLDGHRRGWRSYLSGLLSREQRPHPTNESRPDGRSALGLVRGSPRAEGTGVPRHLRLDVRRGFLRVKVVVDRAPLFVWPLGGNLRRTGAPVALVESARQRTPIVEGQRTAGWERVIIRNSMYRNGLRRHIPSRRDDGFRRANMARSGVRGKPYRTRQNRRCNCAATH
jgi:hypothetical protein